MEKRFDVVTLGEILIDFAPMGLSENGKPLFEANPGGSVSNLVAAVQKQGGKTAYIGKVGEDMFGYQLRDTLKQYGINSDGLRYDNDYRTTLAFVSLDETGNRSFAFYRKPGADCMLRSDEVDVELIKSAKVLHFASLSLTQEPSRTATHHALTVAKENGLTISYDPNLRRSLWDSEEHAREQIISGLEHADILKISDEEFEFITGDTDFEARIPDFAHKYGIACVFVTLGPRGAYYYCNGFSGVLPTYDVKIVDTTGSGDAFLGAVLRRVTQLEGGIKSITTDEMIQDIVRYANASGSLTARMKGGMPAMPTVEMINDCMANTKLLV